MSPTKKRHKGNFVGGYLDDAQFEKLKRIEARLAAILGQSDASRSMTLRYIIENFDESRLPRPPENRE